MDAERRGLRVLMTADTIGGVWPFAIELSTELVRGGNQVLLAAMGREPDAGQRRQAAAIRGLTLCARPYKLVWMGDPWSDLKASGRWLLELAREFVPDVVHLNDLAHGELSWPAPVLVTAHSCVCSWWQAVHGVPAPPAWDRYRARVSACLHAADVVVAPSQTMLASVLRHYGPVAPSRVIHNGRTRAQLAMQAGAAKEPFVLGAGRLWDQAKNLGALATIASRLAWPVYLAGETRSPDGDVTEVAATHALGRLPDGELRRWMARAAIYALPARYEPFGLSPLEAAQCGCALVLGDIASLREVWDDAALYVAPDDHAALADALRRLIEDASLRATMAHRAQARALRYSPQAMARRYRAAYADAMRTHARFERPESRAPDIAIGAQA